MEAPPALPWPAAGWPFPLLSAVGAGETVAGGQQGGSRWHDATTGTASKSVRAAEQLPLGAPRLVRRLCLRDSGWPWAATEGGPTMVSLQPHWSPGIGERCVGSDRRVGLRGHGGQDDGRAGCRVPLETVS